MVPVKGKVTLDGQPMPAGSVAFQTRDPFVGRPAVAFVDSDGTFTVSSIKPNDGMMPGEYLIAILPPSSGTLPGEKKLPDVKVPAKYQDGKQSGFTLTLQRGDAPKFLELDLKSN